jgi:hypothetical protein
MTTEYKLNTLIEWTDEDRAKGECPVPKGSDVTVWFIYDTCQKIAEPTTWDWSDDPTLYDEVIIAYLIHSVPREPIVRWMMVGGECNGFWYGTEDFALEIASEHGGRVVKLVEEIE